MFSSSPKADAKILPEIDHNSSFYFSSNSLFTNHSLIWCYTDLSQWWTKVKLYPCNGPWRPIGLCDVEDPTLSRHSAHRWQEDCQPYAPAALYSPETLFLSFWYSWVNLGLVRPEGLGKLKKFFHLIRSWTLDLRFVTQCFNHYAIVRLQHHQICFQNQGESYIWWGHRICAEKYCIRNAQGKSSCS
jgi:hypothetical protein